MTQNKRFLSYVAIAVILLFLICGIYGYFGLLSPLHQQIESVDAEMKQQKTFLDNATTTAAVTTQNSENTFALQEEVPVKPLVDQLMLQFEKAEVLSDSLILTMDFSDGEAIEDEEEVAEEEDTEEAEPEGNTEADTEAPAAEENVSNTDDDMDTSETTTLPEPEVLPQGVKKITAEMSVVSKNYEGILKFIKTVEELKRVIVVEAITFSGMDELEIASADAVKNQLKYEITISAYYLPELTDYLKDLPRGEFPPPNGKENPLIQDK